jgi:hypothetical protein
MKPILLPLAMIWLAAHGVLLMLVLSLKFLTAKAAALILIAAVALWFVASRKRRILLPSPGMV